MPIGAAIAAKVLSQLRGKATGDFNRRSNRKIAPERTTQVNAKKTKTYIKTPSSSVRVPPVAKQFAKAGKKRIKISRPTPKLELAPPVRVAVASSSSTAEKINSAKIPPVLTRKEKLKQQFRASTEAKKVARSNSKGMSH